MGDYPSSDALPPGFRFFPSDEELVVHFLHRKAAHLPCQPNIIPTLDLHQFDPWDLSGKALQGGNQLWYFFARNTQHRATPNGHWNPLGVDETIIINGDQEVGFKRILVFYFGDIKTNWIMHEYHLSNSIATTSSISRSPSKKRATPKIQINKWIICGVYETSCDSQTGFHDGGRELSCLDEVFLSFDDLDEVSFPN